MSPLNRFARFRQDGRAVAALEFAFVAPVLLLVLAAAADYGLAMWSRSCVSNAVAQGAFYAFLTGTNVTAANVKTVVQSATTLTGVTAVVTYDKTKCYCPTGTPAVLGASVTCGTNCTDGTPAGNYLTIVGKYTLTANLPLVSLLQGKVTTDTAVVRLK